jgi:hypothetical protein
MPRHSADILALAKRGAEHRFRELRDELASLVRQFPHLNALGGGTTRAPKAKAASLDASAAPRRRRRMSAAARKRISEAQKARWAKLRKAKS